MKIAVTTIARFWSKVDIKDPNECWEWTASIGGHGYGQITIDKKPVTAHRLSFFIANNHWPSMCCHICNNKKCVNPNHLYDGTAKSNALDAVKDGVNWQSNKTECPSGHLYNGKNLYVDNKGHRWCRTCHSEASKRYRERKRK